MLLAQSGHDESIWAHIVGTGAATALDYGHTLLALKDALNALHYIACECQDGTWADQAQAAIDMIPEHVLELLGGSHNVVPS
jgi:hypothetical protein